MYLLDVNGSVVYEGGGKERRKIVQSYKYGVDEPPIYPPETKARELADALDRILRWTNLAIKLPNEFWTYDYHKQGDDGGDVWVPPSEFKTTESADIVKMPPKRRPTEFRLPDSEETVVLPMAHRATEESAKNLRKCTLLKAIRAIWGKPKVSFVPLLSNRRSDVHYFPENCVMVNMAALGVTIKVAMVKQNSLIEGMFSEDDRKRISEYMHGIYGNFKKAQRLALKNEPEEAFHPDDHQVRDKGNDAGSTKGKGKGSEAIAKREKGQRVPTNKDELLPQRMTQQHPVDGEAIVNTNGTLRGQGLLRQVGGPMIVMAHRRGIADDMTNAAKKHEGHEVF